MTSAGSGTLRETGIEGVILGRALYERKLDFGQLRADLRGW